MAVAQMSATYQGTTYQYPTSPEQWLLKTLLVKLKGVDKSECADSTATLGVTAVGVI